MGIYKTYDEAKAAHPDCDAVLTTGPKWAGGVALKNTFNPVRIGEDGEFIDCDCEFASPLMCVHQWVVAKAPKTVYEKVNMNTSEIAKAMIDGEVFYSEDGKVRIQWIDGRFMANDAAIISIDSCLQFYRKVENNLEWYEDIPEGGVLCWVWDYEDPDCSDLVIEVVINHHNTDSYKYGTLGGTRWKRAQPLTKEEIQKFMWNAPV